METATGALPVGPRLPGAARRFTCEVTLGPSSTTVGWAMSSQIAPTVANACRPCAVAMRARLLRLTAPSSTSLVSKLAQRISVSAVSGAHHWWGTCCVEKKLSDT